MSTLYSLFSSKTKLYSTADCSKVGASRDTSTEEVHRSTFKNEKKALLVLILSAPNNAIKRHALRRTWISFIDQKQIRYYFVIGGKNIGREEKDALLEEKEHYPDLLILPELEEGYDLLSNKLLASFSWAAKNIEFDFVLKVDDDSYVNIRQLHIDLIKRMDEKRLYWGYFNGRAQIQRKGKWKEENWNLCDRYLPYARGGGYVLSRQLIQYLAQNAVLLSIYKSEDVSLGAWLAPLNVTRIHDIRFDTEWASRGCSNEHLITHPHDISGIYQLHEALANKGRMCKLEVTKRPAYIYDWTVLPSQCCNNPAP